MERHRLPIRSAFSSEAGRGYRDGRAGRLRTPTADFCRYAI